MFIKSVTSDFCSAFSHLEVKVSMSVNKDAGIGLISYGTLKLFEDS